MDRDASECNTASQTLCQLLQDLEDRREGKGREDGGGRRRGERGEDGGEERVRERGGE